VTFVTLPVVAVTLMPPEGLTPWLPFAGVIFSSAASIAARALAAAAAAAADAEAAALTWPGLGGCAWPPQAVPRRPMAAAAAMVAKSLRDLRSLPRTVTLLGVEVAAGPRKACNARLRISNGYYVVLKFGGVRVAMRLLLT
jgi:hypothetical protein